MSLATRLFPTGRGAEISSTPTYCHRCHASNWLKEDYIHVGELKERIFVGWAKFCGSCGSDSLGGQVPAREFVWLLADANRFNGCIAFKNGQEVFPSLLRSKSDDGMIVQLAEWILKEKAGDKFYSRLAVDGGEVAVVAALKELRQAMADEWDDWIEDTLVVPAFLRDKQLQLFA